MPVGPYKEDLEEHYHLELKQKREESLTSEEKKKLKKQFYIKKYKSLPNLQKEPLTFIPVLDEKADSIRTSKRHLQLKRKLSRTESSSVYSSKSAKSNLGQVLKKKFHALRKQHKTDFQRLKESLPFILSTSSASSSALLLEAATTSGHNVEPFSCFLCHDAFYGSLEDFNEHLDYCLQHPAHPTPNDFHNSSLTYRHRRGINYDETEAELEEMEYEKEGLDIQNEDQVHYGAPQYSRTHLAQFSDVLNSETAADFSREDEEPNSVESGGHLLPFRKENAFGTSVEDSFCRAETSRSSNIHTSNFILEALKQKIQQLESLGSCVPKCQICLDCYKAPLVSVNCWHTHCEVCWFKSLSMKKVCPQCQVIVRPEDLRKIYM